MKNVVMAVVVMLTALGANAQTPEPHVQKAVDALMFIQQHMTEGDPASLKVVWVAVTKDGDVCLEATANNNAGVETRGEIVLTDGKTLTGKRNWDKQHCNHAKTIISDTVKQAFQDAILKTAHQAPAVPQEPLNTADIRGYHLGETWLAVRPRLIADYQANTKTEASQKYGYDMNKSVYGFGFVPEVSKLDHANGQGTLTLYYGAYMHKFTFEAGKLVEVSAYFQNQSFDDMLPTATQKYGKPETVTEETLQNGFGARWVVHHATWFVNGDPVGMEETISDGQRRDVLITIETAAHLNKNAAARDAKKPVL